MDLNLGTIRHPFFIGIAGSGMSALAQYLAGTGKKVSGSDRFFMPGEPNEIKEKLEKDGIACYIQDGSGIHSATDLVVASTAIEETVIEIQKARALGIPVIKRSELLALIAESKRTIAVGGTSGKSTTVAMLFAIMEYAGWQPSIITGAGLVNLIREGRIGNAKVGEGEWLIIEADESDGSIVQYKPEIGLLLNLDKDHQETTELVQLFTVFRDNSRFFSVNTTYPQTRELSKDNRRDFSTDPSIPAAYTATDFIQEGLHIHFRIREVAFEINQIGRHNMENALAAVTVANSIGISLEKCAEALRHYEGIYRRQQVYGSKHGVILVDDFAHNPVKCAAAIRACQPLAPRLIAWFQPHGYKPTKFLRDDFVNEIAAALRPADEIWMSEIFYAGGTAVKDISSADLIDDLRQKNKGAFFIADREEFPAAVRPHLTDNCVLLLMGARDPSLERFAKKVWEEL
jgi:UDP-N-acetylmuramate--alanine ligase